MATPWPAADALVGPLALCTRFRDAARATGGDHRPHDAPEHLRGTAAEIWLAVHHSDTAKAFAAVLNENGIELAVVTKDEAERSRTDAAAAREKGRYAPVYREHEIVAVDDCAFVYRLNEVTTGSSFGDMQRYLRTLDRSNLQGIEATKQLMHERAEGREAYAQLAALLNPVKPREKDPRPTGRHGHEVRPAAANENIGDKIAKTPALMGLSLLGSAAHAISDGFSNLFAPPNPKTLAEHEEDYRLYQVAAEQAEHVADHRAKIARHEQIRARHHEEERDRER